MPGIFDDRELIELFRLLAKMISVRTLYEIMDKHPRDDKVYYEWIQWYERWIDEEIRERLAESRRPRVKPKRPRRKG